MMMAPTAFLTLSLQVTLVVLLISMALVTWRLAAGPSAADRVVAMDLLSVLVLAFVVVFAIYTRETSYLDVAIAYACIAFLGTIAMARFLMRASDRMTRRQGEGKLDE